MKLFDLIVNDAPDLKTRKLLDRYIEFYRTNERSEKRNSGLPNNIDHSELFDLNRILVHDELLEFTPQHGFILKPKSVKFEGYVNNYYNLLWQRIFSAIWNLVAAIIIPLVVVYFTIKFTVTDPEKDKQEVRQQINGLEKRIDSLINTQNVIILDTTKVQF